MSIYGGLGSDNVSVSPNSVSPVEARNLRGHRGIIEHAFVSSDDIYYDGLIVRGIEAAVLDNDGDYGWICIVDQVGPHLMTEDSVGAFSFHVYPTTLLQDDLYVNIVAPASRDRQGYVLINNATTNSLHWRQGEMGPKEVHVTYNPDAMKLETSDLSLSLKLFVDLDEGRTKDARFINNGKVICLFQCISSISRKALTFLNAQNKRCSL